MEEASKYLQLWTFVCLHAGDTNVMACYKNKNINKHLTTPNNQWPFILFLRKCKK